MSSRAAVPREDTSRLVGGPSGVQQQLTPQPPEKKGTPEAAPLGAVVGEHLRARSVLGTLPDGQKTGLWRTLNQVWSEPALASPRLVALDQRWQRQQESRRGWAIDTRLAPGACSGAPERPRINTTISQPRPCGPGTAHRPVGTEPGCGRLGGGLRDGVAVPPRHWHPTAMPPALNRATQAPRPRSAHAPLDLVQSGGWLPPPYSNLRVPPARDAQAERPRRVWVGLTSG